jgi:hypothetical protein
MAERTSGPCRSHRHGPGLVGVAGFEPTTSSSRSRSGCTADLALTWANAKNPRSERWYSSVYLGLRTPYLQGSSPKILPRALASTRTVSRRGEAHLPRPMACVYDAGYTQSG